MTLRWRTTGPWGASVGRDLFKEEIDENFYTLKLAIDAKPDAVSVRSIASITQAGTTITVNYNDATTDGPFQLPIAMPIGIPTEWSPLTPMTALHWITVSNHDDTVAPDTQLGTYLILQSHTSAATFDPDRQIGGDDVYALLVPQIEPEIIQPAVTFGAQITTDRSTILDDANKWFDVLKGSLCLITVSPVEDEAYTPGDTITFEDIGGNQIEIAEGAGVVVNPPPSATRKSRGLHSTIQITYKGGNTWTLSGDLELV